MKASPFCAMLIFCVIGMGCSGPTFSYASRQRTTVDQFRNVSLDPRQDVIPAVEDMHLVRNEEVRNQVIREFEAKGYRFVPSDVADLWLDVFTLVPGASRRYQGP